jgi:hypothetical protein
METIYHYNQASFTQRIIDRRPRRPLKGEMHKEAFLFPGPAEIA